MSKTKIEWAEHVWNPITGCTRVGEGCRNCYALKQFDWNLWDYGPEITFHPDRLDKPLRRKIPTHYFVCSMGDLFHDDVKSDWIGKVLTVIDNSRQHTFTVLTKRPKRMRALMGCGDWLAAYGVPMKIPNLRLYVSVWDQPSADEFIPILLDTPAAVRGLSIEPMLSPITFRWRPWVNPSARVWEGGRAKITNHLDSLKGIHHVICGGETGPGARPMHPDWARSVRDQCHAAGVPLFFKQWGEWVPCNITFEGLKHHEWNCGYIGAPKPRYSLRVGKKAAGNILDGRTWEELPSA